MQRKYFVFFVFLVVLMSIWVCASMVYSPLDQKEQKRTTQSRISTQDIELPEEQIPSEEETAYQYSYNELENMNEVSIEGNEIHIVLYENQAIPYRWYHQLTGENVELMLNETVDGTAAWNEAGNSPTYHVFVFEVCQDGQAEITIHLARMDDRTEISEKRSYFVDCNQNVVSCERLFEVEE